MLDVHLNGKTVFPFAAELEARDIPFLFATAYGRTAFRKNSAATWCCRSPSARWSCAAP